MLDLDLPEKPGENYRWDVRMFTDTTVIAELVRTDRKLLGLFTSDTTVFYRWVTLRKLIHEYDEESLAREVSAVVTEEYEKWERERDLKRKIEGSY